jgi:hypothetical protein
MRSLVSGEARSAGADARADASDDDGLLFADKVGIGIGAAGFAIIVYLWLLAVIAAGFPAADHLLAHASGFATQWDLAIAVGVWAVLRIVHIVRAAIAWWRQLPPLRHAFSQWMLKRLAGSDQTARG